MDPLNTKSDFRRSYAAFHAYDFSTLAYRRDGEKVVSYERGSAISVSVFTVVSDDGSTVSVSEQLRLLRVVFHGTSISVYFNRGRVQLSFFITDILYYG